MSLARGDISFGWIGSAQACQTLFGFLRPAKFLGM